MIVHSSKPLFKNSLNAFVPLCPLPVERRQAERVRILLLYPSGLEMFSWFLVEKLQCQASDKSRRETILPFLQRTTKLCFVKKVFTPNSSRFPFKEGVKPFK